MNLELDLGFDSLERVELFGAVEAELSLSISEQEASRILTLGEMIHALGQLSDTPNSTGSENRGHRPQCESRARYACGRRRFAPQERW